MLSRIITAALFVILVSSMVYGYAAGAQADNLAVAQATDACNNIALNKPASATASLAGSPPSLAVDGTTDTLWNSGQFAPQSIEINLGSPQTVDEIRMYVAQSPVGNTTHEVWVAGSNKVYTKVDTTTAFTVDNQLTTHVFSPALMGIQWIKVVTTSSPSWVAWREIQVCQTPLPTSTPANTPTNTPEPPACNNIALNKPASATASLAGYPTGLAVDGTTDTLWNSGQFAPQAIEVNLGSPQTVDEIRMYVAQTPVGDTTHEVWVAGSNKVYTKIDTTTAFTIDNQLTRHIFSPALTGIQWIKVVTTSSPSWVAWREIQVCQTPIAPTATLTPVASPVCDNLSLNKPAFATASLPSTIPSMAVDGDINSQWNSGQFAPQYIEINLESPQTVDEIWMFVAQTPVGDTTHEVWVAGSDKVYTKVGTFSGYTINRQETKHVFNPSLTGVQWVKVITTSSPSWVAWWEIQVCRIVNGATATSTATSQAPATATPTSTHTATATGTAIGVPTSTHTATATGTAIGVPTSTHTATATGTAIGGPTSTRTPTPTGTAIGGPTSTRTPTGTATSVPAGTATFTATSRPTSTPVFTATPTTIPNTPGKITGGGQVLLPDGTPKGSFGLTVNYDKGDSAPKGNLNYVDHLTGMHLTSTTLETLVIVDSSHAWFTGWATIDGGQEVWFKVEIKDVNKGTPSPDWFILTIPALNYESGGTMIGGNVTIHKS